MAPPEVRHPSTTLERQFMVTFPHAAARGAARFAVTLALAISVACGGGESTPPGPAPVATVQLATFPTTIYIGSTVQLVATTRDAGGAALTGRAITWSSTNDAVATVSASGAVTGVASGTAVIRATSEGKFTDVSVTVAPVPVVSVVVTPASATVAVGGTTLLTATARDSANGTLNGRAAAWTSSAPTVATVNATTGAVTGVSAGTAVIRATIEGRFAEATITVSSGAAPSISGITPATLTSGVTATITGSNFGPNAADNTVSIDGVAATVTGASSSQLTVTVPQLPCTPSHSARVQVITQGLASTTLHPVRAGTAINIVTSAQVLLSPSQADCAELPSGTGTYVVSVFNTTKASGLDQSNTGLGFRISGELPPASLAASLTIPTVLRQAASVPSAPLVSANPLLGGEARDVSERMHGVILESNRLAYERLRGSVRRTSANRMTVPGGVSASTAAVPLPAIGETRKFRVAQFSTDLGATGSCTNFVEITARAVYVGTRSVVYEDVAAPLANTMDAKYVAIGQEFDTGMYVTDSTYFGDPLVRDAVTDADRHLNMVFTPSMTTGVAGFVTSCDFFPRNTTDNTESNFGEYFYAAVPTVAGTGFSGNTPDQWLRTMRHTIVHEVKHISSFAARIANNATTFEESWLEEGTARHSEELWERNYIYNVAWKANSAYRQTLYCDVRPTFPECTGKPYAMYNHFSTLYGVLESPGASSMFGRVANGDFSFYGSSWAFVRYVMDRYASDEVTFLRGLTQSTTLAGLASISAQAGNRPSAELLTNWSLAMYLDEISPSPDLTFPTWNMRDIFLGMNSDFPNTYTKPFPLVPGQLISPSFTVENGGIKGGGFAMYRVPSNTTGTSSLRIAAPGGTASANSALRVAIVRVP